MNQGSLVSTTKSAPTFPALAYHGTPVLTSEMLAQAYDVSAKQIRQNFNNNRERFVEGKHFFSLTGKELKEFKNCVDLIDTVKIPSRTPILTLWTDRGSARHAKMLESEKAWEVYELLEDTFFSVATRQPEPLPSLDSPITPDQQCTLQAIVKAKVDTIPKEQRTGGEFPKMWSRFNNHFRIAKYAQLPQSRMSEAVEYLTKMMVSEQKALSTSSSDSIYQKRLDALADIEERFNAFRARTAEQMRAFVTEYTSVSENSFCELLTLKNGTIPLDSKHLVTPLVLLSYDAHVWIAEGFRRMNDAFAAAKAANRQMLGR